MKKKTKQKTVTFPLEILDPRILPKHTGGYELEYFTGKTYVYKPIPDKLIELIEEKAVANYRTQLKKFLAIE